MEIFWKIKYGNNKILSQNKQATKLGFVFFPLPKSGEAN